MSNQEQTGGRAAWRRTTLGKALPIRYGKARSEKHGIVREETAVYGSSGVIDTFKRALTNGPTLIIGRKGTVGATHYSAEPCWPIDTVYFTEAEADKDLRFFKYFLDHLQLGKMDRSTAVPGLSRDDYNATEVCIPEVDEQRRIVAEIEKQFTRLEAGVAGLRRVQANLTRYRAAVLKAACEGKLVPTEAELARESGRSFEPGEQLLARILTERRARWKGKRKYKEPAAPDTANLPSLPEGWIWTSVDQVADVGLGKMLDKTKHRTGQQLSYLRNINVRWGWIDTADVLQMFFEDDQVGRYSLRTGDVLVCEGGEPGRAAVWDGRVTGMMYQKALHRVRLFGLFRARYLVFLLEFLAKTGRLQRWFTGSTIKHFTRESFVSLPIPLPPLAEQGRIVAEVEQGLSMIDELEAVVSANLRRAERLRQAVLQRAFSGGLFRGAPI